MTKLTRPMRRETSATAFSRGKHRPIMVSLEPSQHGDDDLLWFRLKGQRQSYALTVSGCFGKALAASVQAAKAAKAQTRRAK